MPPKRCSGKRENKTARRESKWSSFCLKGSRRTGSHKTRDEGIALAERGLIFLFCLGGGGQGSNYLQAASRFRNSDSPDVTHKE